MWRILLILFAIGQDPASAAIVWNPWGSCGKIYGVRDQNCIGTRSRTGKEINAETLKVTTHTGTSSCFLTSALVNGGYTQWTEWEDCSTKCRSKTNKYRYCNEPTPCNLGKDCSDLGSNQLDKDCGPINGQWGTWGSWGTCAMPVGSSGGYGTGTYLRLRQCENPKPICKGDYCVGSNNETGTCRTVPPCLTKKMFVEKFLFQENPMVIYTSAQVDIYLLTKNLCAPGTIVYNFYDLYKINTTSGEETRIRTRLWNLKFMFNPGALDIGLYRLYGKIGYPNPNPMLHWMDESMFVKIEHPPPHAFIKGGSGRTVGEGQVSFDARSVSYSLTKGPGDPSGLTFQWKCLNFVTNSIYKLLQFNLDPMQAFKDETEYEKKWYETSFTTNIQNQVAFIKKTTLYERITYHRSLNATCENADNLYVHVEPNTIKQGKEKKSTESSVTETFDNSTTQEYTTEELTTVQTTVAMTTTGDLTTMDLNATIDPNITTAEPTTTQEMTTKIEDLFPLSMFYDITYLYEMLYDPEILIGTEHVLELTKHETLVKNEMAELFTNLYGEDASSFESDTTDFFTRLSDSSLTLQSLYELRELPGLPASADQQFFNDLKTWLDIAEQSKEFANQLVTLLDDFKAVQASINGGLNLTLYVGIDGYFHLSIDSAGMCLLEYLGQIFKGYFTIDNFDWIKMKTDEQLYLNWLDQELFNSSACSLFTGLDSGTGSLTVTNEDVKNGTGFLVFLRVEFEQSVSYFIQHAQSVSGNPPGIEIECRLNCMKKTALTSIMSLKAACPLCTYDQLLGRKIWWNVKDFDLNSRQSTNNTYWKGWMLSALETKEFVMSANVLNASSGYLIEVFMKLSTGEVSTGIWLVITNILPYNGTCEIVDDFGEKKVTTASWKDEGFRSIKDPTIDWKEQLNYRIVQITSTGKEILLYYGAEEENYIKVKPGDAANSYNVTVKIQVYDIFVDFTECTKDLGPILPDYTSGNDASVSSSLQTYGVNISYFHRTGNVKQVAMNAEVAGTPLNLLTPKPTTIFDTDPIEWVNLGVEKTENGSVKKSFEELWDMYQNPDLGDVTTATEIINSLMSYTTVLDDISDTVDGTSTVNIDQIANSMGTILSNKEYAANQSASNAFKGNKRLVEKLVTLTNNETYPKYEDFISTCEGILRVLNYALEAILPKLSANAPNSLDIYTVMDTIANREVFSEANNADLTPAEKAFIASEVAKKNELDAQIKNDLVQKEVQVLLDSISFLGHVLKMLNYRKQMPVYVQNGNINSTEEEKLIPELIDNGVENNGININFVGSGSNSTVEQPVQITLYDHTPFSWDDESKYITSKTVTISVGDENNTNAAIPSKIKIPNSGVTIPYKSVQLAIPTDRSEFTSQMLIYTMYWKNTTDSLIFSILNAMEYLDHVIYMRKKESPTEETYDLMKMIQPNDWLKSDEIKIIMNGGFYTEPTNVYFGIKISSNTTNTTNTGNRRRRSTTDIVYYYILGITTGCRVWDSQKWDRTSCKLSAQSTINDTVCECTNPPGNNFATTFYVPPNTIDFGSVFSKFDLKSNAAVFATVISLIGIYMLICVWAFRQDKRDHDRWALSYLVDNAPYDEYLYILTVYTGLHRNAGTNSNIRFIIIDGKANKKGKVDVKTEVRQLDDRRHKGFGVGSVKRFVMSVSKRIQDPAVIKIWHDNSGGGNYASWYLNKIVLEDIQTQEKYVFACDKWLSLDHDDGCIECTIPILDKSKKNFSFLFNEKTRQSTTDSHLWLSVAIRPEESSFTRFERLACCLTFLFLTMISNAMFYGQDTGSKITLGPITFSLSGIYISFISALIAAPALIIVTYMFRNSRPRQRKVTRKNIQPTVKTNDLLSIDYDKEDDGRSMMTYSKLPLPFWCRYIAWGIVTVAVLVSGFFLILYSMEWGKSKSEEWLLCFFLSFIESIFIVDPVKIIIVSVILSLLIKSHVEKSSNYDKEKLLTETKKRTSSALAYCIESYKHKQTLAAPLKPSKVAEMKAKRKAILRVHKTFIELVLYLVFLGCLYLVSFSNRDSRWFYLTQHLDNQLITLTNVSSGDLSFRYSQVKSASDLYIWIDATLIPFLFPLLSVNGDKLKAYQRLYGNDLVSFKVGPMRVRQVRGLEGSCMYQIFNNTKCYDKYTILKEEDSDYCVAWENQPCVRGQAVYNITSDAWSFVSAVDTWGLPTTGLHSTYSGGGYISEFIVNYNISKLILNDLYKYVWIDRKTRAVFIEFTLYNGDNNVFVYISFLCEFPEIGGTLISTSIKPFRPYQHVGSLGVAIVVCEIIVLIGIVIFGIRKILLLYHHGKKILKGVWNILDLLIIIIFLVCTVMYIGRWIMTNHAMDKFQSNKNKFVNFSHIAWWDELFNSLLAFVIFLTTLRIMRVLSYNDRMNQLGYVLANVSRDLGGCFVMFLLVYTAFVTFGHLIFGRQLGTYKNLFVSSTTLVNAIIGKNSINDLFSVEPVLGRAYYFFFVLFLLWILMTMLNATLNTGITSVRMKLVKTPQSYGITNILLNMWKSTVGMLMSDKTDKNIQEKQIPTDYVIHKDFPKDIIVMRQKEKSPTFVRRKIIYQ